MLSGGVSIPMAARGGVRGDHPQACSERSVQVFASFTGLHVAVWAYDPRFHYSAASAPLDRTNHLNGSSVHWRAVDKRNAGAEVLVVPRRAPPLAEIVL